MNLPAELQPTATIDVPLPSGAVRQLPVCHPVFISWPGKMFDFGRKPILLYQGETYFAELVILRMLQKRGWDGVWVNSFGRCYLDNMPKDWALRERVSIPDDKEKILKDIQRTARTSSSFDVFAWNGSQVLFCEAKHRNEDNFTAGQLRFTDAALSRGILPERLLVVEWTSA
jgi:hypothetical protein